MFAIRADHTFDGEDFRAGGATVLVEDGRIVGVESAAYELPAECELVDHGNATVLPGLIDTHVHLVGDSGAMALERVPGNSPEQIKAVVTEALRRQLAAGVTTVRDLGDWHFNVVQRRDAQRQVDDRLPWIVASGPPITIRGGHCGFLGGEVSGASEIVAAERERAERHVDVVKVMARGGMMTAGTDVFVPQFSIEELWLLVEQSHAAGLPVTAHAHAAAAVDQAVAVGVDGIEHATYLVRLADGPGPEGAARHTCHRRAAGGLGRERYPGRPYPRWLHYQADGGRVAGHSAAAGRCRHHARGSCRDAHVDSAADDDIRPWVYFRCRRRHRPR